MNTLAAMTAEIVAAYVHNNRLSKEDLPELIASIHRALASLPHAEDMSGMERGLKPAVPINRSVTPNFIICLEDGKRFKSLKRHLRAEHDLTPALFREKWGLPASYPMVAPNYAKKRSQLAHQTRLGKRSPIGRTQSKKPDC
ncbi:MAG: MucR family transcriptional regulator [Rhizobiaceae bacterium]